MQISVCCPSYKRPKVETLEYLPFCKVYVDPPPPPPPAGPQMLLF